MRYLLATRSKAEAAGFGMFGRTVVNRRIVLNEKEVMSSGMLNGATLEERAGELGADICSHNEIVNILNKKKNRRK